MRKYHGLGAKAVAVAAACVLLAACGKEQKTVPGVTQTPDMPGQPTPGETQQPDMPKPQEPDSGQDIPGNADSEETDEERAQHTVVKDGQSGFLMYQGLCYELLDEETVRVSDYYDMEITKLSIPDTITYGDKTYRVTRVGENVFSYFYGLEQVVLGNNVEVLEESAFTGCSELTEVVFGTGLTQIGAHAFEACDMLAQISIPEGVTSIGSEAFCSCVSLYSITLPSTLLSLGDNMFFDCESLVSVSIPASVETIPFGLFTNCASLEEVQLAEGLLVIGQESFWACESLKSLVFPESLAVIGERAFYNSGLESITFPDKRVSVGDGIFDFCENIAKIYVTAETQEYYEDALDYELEFVVLQ